ncbi:ABC transporter ATP-binding protein [Vandammella animalimorsus]|uniref:ABC transporter ATP-binding protein n=1 Tax=Vandammella animalimorsus TaxID=2029117 RepID=UPI00325C2B38
MSHAHQAPTSAAPAVSAAPLLAVENLHVRYGKSAALLGAQLQLGQGELVCVIGPNGAGKSSLLNALMGCLPANGNASGTVRIAGQDVSALPLEQRVKRGLALVPETRELFASMSVEDNLILGSYLLRHQGAAQRQALLQEIFALFPRLKERRKQPAGTMSGGERQMLVIGRALMSRPRALMLDEPSLGLAPKIMNEVFAIIEDLRAQGLGILLVEQNSRAALRAARYAYVLELGAITLHGPAQEVANHPQVIEAYLGKRQAAVANSGQPGTL